MKYIADKLEEMDKSFAKKKESEKWMMILGVAGIITAIAYTYLLPYSEDMYNTTDAEKTRLNKSIAEKNIYLNGITVGGDRNFYIKKYDRDIKNKKSNISSLDKKIDYINVSLDKLSPLLFNKKSWAIFLNSIAANAKINSIEIQSIRNNYTDTLGSFGHVLEVEIKGYGDFKNMVKFLNLLEQNTLVTDIYSSKLEGSDQGINTDFNISVWGINH